MIYSNTIFSEMAKRDSISFTPKQGSYLVGVFSLLCSLVAPLPLHYFNRRPLLFYGQFSMAACLGMTATSYIIEQDKLIIIFLCLAILCFQFSCGPIAWMYAGEVAVDTGLGICILALYLSLLELAITMQFMVNGFLGPSGMFYTLSFVTFIGSFFVFCFVRETKGLTDKEKK
mmetsp:Transcript_2630/g.4394  ORF Transcript_2630/g.4394 Transcript_2630/m.4394 type:complete len:173 (+) Transcript_2630:1059-1577(+)